MNFDFVDIGTSDFDTSLDKRKKGQTVLLVEPIFSYLKNLPDGEGIFKANFAISNRHALRPIFYVKPDTIFGYNFPEWISGCNSLDRPHPTVERLLKESNLQKSFNDIVTVETVLLITFAKLVDLYEIKKIGFLKIDTEGHDHIILKDVLSMLKKKKIKIEKIKFEYDPFFGNTKELDKLIKKSGFKKVELVNNNVTLS